MDHSGSSGACYVVQYFVVCCSSSAYSSPQSALSVCFTDLFPPNRSSAHMEKEIAPNSVILCQASAFLFKMRDLPSGGEQVSGN